MLNDERVILESEYVAMTGKPSALRTRVAELEAERDRLAAVVANSIDPMKDILSGWRYIRQSHGDLYGVGWDRAQDGIIKAIAAAEAAKARTA